MDGAFSEGEIKPSRITLEDSGSKGLSGMYYYVQGRGES